MEFVAPITEVRGSEVRCSGMVEQEHQDEVIDLPEEGIATCPQCGRQYRRAALWKRISSAVWPRQG